MMKMCESYKKGELIEEMLGEGSKMLWTKEMRTLQSGCQGSGRHGNVTASLAPAPLAGTVTVNVCTEPALRTPGSATVTLCLPGASGR